MKNLLIVSICLILFIYSCTNNEENYSLTPSARELLTEIDTIFIKTPMTEPQIPVRIQDSNSTNHGIVTLYDNKQHTIFLFNSKNNDYETKIKLDKSGPNFVAQVYSIYYHNSDSIFILDYNMIDIIDIHGVVKNRIKLDNHNLNIENKFKGLKIHTDINNSKSIYFLKNKLYFGLYPHEINKSSSNFPLVGYYDLKDKDFGYINIKLPDLLVENAYYGKLHDYTLNFYDSNIYLGLNGFPAIFRYSLEGELISSAFLDNSSQYTYANEIESSNQSNRIKLIEHENQNALYMKLQKNANGIIALNYLIPAPERPGMKKGKTLIFNNDLSKYSLLKNENSLLYSLGDEYYYAVVYDKSEKFNLESGYYLKRYKLSFE